MVSRFVGVFKKATNTIDRMAPMCLGIRATIWELDQCSTVLFHKRGLEVGEPIRILHMIVASNGILDNILPSV